MHARTFAIAMISSLASVGAPPAVAFQSQTEPETVLGYVASLDGDLLVLSNVPTVAPGRVFQLGEGQMFIADPAGGEGAAEPPDGEMRVFARREGETVPATADPKGNADSADCHRALG